MRARRPHARRGCSVGLRVQNAACALAPAFRGIALAALVAFAIPSHVAGAPWFVRIVDPANPVVTDLAETGGGAWADLDGDGLPELFSANGNLTIQNDALYRALGGLSYARVVTVPMASDGGSSIGGTWGDYDNDGRLDLFVTNRNFHGNFLYHALGDTLFERVLAGPIAGDQANSNSSSWVDLNGDGALDLFVVNFQQPDDLYLNSGPPSWTFTAVDTGLVLGGTEFSIPGAWCDHDDDGDFDLFVGNAGVQNDYLFVHGAGLSFSRVILPDGRSTLGASWGDFDNDGDLDLFTASFQNQVSLLYANSGAPGWGLTGVAVPAFAANPGNAVGSGWGDFDNDGDLDLYVARDGGQNNLLYVNQGPPTYGLERVDTLGVSADGGNSFGCSWVDADADGDLDLFVANRSNQANFLYRNDGANGNWLSLRLIGGPSNRAAIGARVRVRAGIGGGARWQVRDVEAQSGYNSQTLQLHFGLGDATVADTVRVRWPSGHVDELVGLAANRAYVVQEQVGALDVDDRPASGEDVAWTIAPQPMRDAWAVEFLLAQASHVSLEVVDVTGRVVARAEPGVLAAGRHRIAGPTFAGPSGVYFARLMTYRGVQVRKLIRLE
jgi:hypothetical protein